MSTDIQETDIKILGILNCTPDSFYDGNRCEAAERIAKGWRLWQEGATYIDIGGESTRPGADPISLQEECDRVLPVIEALVRLGCHVSADTRRAEVARQAINAGATLINDVSAGADPQMVDVIASSGLPYIAMHMQGQPQNMQNAPSYGNVVADVLEYFLERTQQLTSAGIAEDKIIWDPGIGFGKNLDHNLDLLNHLDQFTEGNRSVCLGVSRKSFIHRIDPSTAKMAEDRLPGSLAPLVKALTQGVRFFRVHDVAQTLQFFRVLLQIQPVIMHRPS